MMDAVRGLTHAMHTIACVGLMIDPRDLGSAVVDGTENETGPKDRMDPTIYLYDSVPGGVGLASRLFAERAGANLTAPATLLWDEYVRARAALLGNLMANPPEA